MTRRAHLTSTLAGSSGHAYDRATGQLPLTEDRFRRALQIETVGVLFFDLEGRITDANDAFLQMSGFSREDLHAGLLRWDELTPPEWMAASLRAVEEFKATGRTKPLRIPTSPNCGTPC